LKIAFKIPPHIDDYSSLHLVAEAGSDEVSFLIFEKQPFTAHGFYTFNFDKHLSVSALSEKVAEIIESENVLSRPFASSTIFYNYREVTPVPDEYFIYGQNEAVCNLLFGEDKRTIVFHENIKAIPAKVIYRAPQKVHDMLRNHFAGSIFKHAASQITEQSGNVIDCTVYHSTIKLVVWKNGKLQLLQYFDYTSPADVVFHLLNTCRQLDLPPEEVKLLLSGMIVESSVLYEEIYKYFLHVELKVLPQEVSLAGKLNDHPHHFYSHLIEPALCV
jgi:hypothetical protein